MKLASIRISYKRYPNLGRVIKFQLQNVISSINFYVNWLGPAVLSLKSLIGHQLITNDGVDFVPFVAG